MASRNILHMVTPLKHMSPFDVNMAIDAGYDAVIPYAQVSMEEIKALVQDAIFSRNPADGPRTGLFIAGKNALTALDMLHEAEEAFVPPFGLSVFADPAGSFTTAAAMLACVVKRLKEKTGLGLAGRNVAVFGGTGVVGFCTAVLSANEGASVKLVGHDGDGRVKRSAADMQARFGARVKGADGSSEEKRRDIVAESHVVLTAGPAGVQVIAPAVAAAGENLVVAADVNAVPPAGFAGIGVHDNGAPIEGTKAVGIGALTIGDVKYKTQAGLFRKMIESDKLLTLDFRHAYQLAREIVGA
jgi:methylene-tetrahydromethanopterin dehydrogenase